MRRDYKIGPWALTSCGVGISCSTGSGWESCRLLGCVGRMVALLGRICSTGTCSASTTDQGHETDSDASSIWRCGLALYVLCAPQ